jgi:hypothetical protein
MAEDYQRFIDQDLRNVDQANYHYDDDGRPSPARFKLSLERGGVQPPATSTVLKAASRFKKPLRQDKMGRAPTPNPKPQSKTDRLEMGPTIEPGLKAEPEPAPEPEPRFTAPRFATQTSYVDQSDPKVTIFAAWANSHLQARGMSVANLAIDFDNGMLFAELLRAIFRSGSTYASPEAAGWVEQVQRCEHHPTTTLHKLVHLRSIRRVPLSGLTCLQFLNSLLHVAEMEETWVCCAEKPSKSSESDRRNRTKHRGAVGSNSKRHSRASDRDDSRLSMDIDLSDRAF